jgi:hypothetical protein
VHRVDEQHAGAHPDPRPDADGAALAQQVEVARRRGRAERPHAQVAVVADLRDDVAALVDADRDEQPHPAVRGARLAATHEEAAAAVALGGEVVGKLRRDLVEEAPLGADRGRRDGEVRERRVGRERCRRRKRDR